MRIYLDTEFNGFGGSLISAAIYNPHGESWYEVAEVPKDTLPWVAKNVIPVLGKKPIGYDFLRTSLHAYLLNLKFKPTIVADWPEDFVHFCRLICADGGQQLPFECSMELVLSGAYEPIIRHNAMEDAKALGKWHLCHLMHTQVGIRGETAKQRFDRQWTPDPNTGCWIWAASFRGDGYGQFHYGERPWRIPLVAHRASYMLYKGAIPDGRDLDHLCCNKWCVNPNHLEAVTRSVNILRGRLAGINRARAAEITHCPQGHPYDHNNTYLGQGKSGIARHCKECRKVNKRKHYAATRDRSLRVREDGQ
jgi:hypothetical protein